MTSPDISRSTERGSDFLGYRVCRCEKGTNNQNGETMHILRYLRKLKFQWVAITNAILLLGAQVYLYYLQKQPPGEQIEAIKAILNSNNSSMLWYLVIGSGFYAYTRYREKKAGYTGQFMSSLWIPLSAWAFGMLVTTLMTIDSIAKCYGYGFM